MSIEDKFNPYISREDKFESRGERKNFGKKDQGEQKFQKREAVKGEGEFEKRMTRILDLGGRKGQVREIFTAKTHKGLRINPLIVKDREGVEQIKQALVDSGVEVFHLSWYPDGLIVPAKDIPLIMTLPMAGEGKVFVQNPSSYLPILALDPKPGERYLDVCSAPGGKAALYAGLSKGESDLYLVDDNSFRVNKKMKEVLEIQKVKPKEIIICDARTLLESRTIESNSFDKVLADVDCSSEGLINFESKNPLQTWLFKTHEQFASLQGRILSVAYEALKPGGIMVYSTCTLAPEENEGVVSRFLEKTPSAILQKVTLEQEKTLPAILDWPKNKINPELEKSLRVNPDHDYMEGFFVCRIYKPLQETDDEQGIFNKIKNEEAKQVSISLDEMGQAHSVYNK